MRYKLYIPFTNEHKSFRKMADNYPPGALVIDNRPSDDRNPPNPFGNLRTIVPSAPLHFSQIMNMIRKLAIDSQLDFYLWAHADCVCDRHVFDGLAERMSRRLESGERLGVLFTFYDILSAVSVECAQRVGEWDWRFFPQYYADNDYYRRVRLAGYSTPTDDELAKCVVHDNGGGQSKRDRRKDFADSGWWPVATRFYALKWGGGPDREQFDVPKF